MSKHRAFLGLVAGLLVAGCQNSATTSPAANSSAPPQLEIKDRRASIGEIDGSKPSEYAFAVRNTGGQPLQLTLTKKSCSCGEIEVPGAIAPDQSGSIKFRWTPQPSVSGPYTLSADLASNDPKASQVRLEVTGDVRPRYRLAPAIDYLDFEGVRPGSAPVEKMLKIFSTKVPNFKLQATTVTKDIEVATEPLLAGEMVEDLKILSGYRLILKTTDRMPAGYFRDELTLTMTAGNETQRLVLPMYAEVQNGLFTVVPSEVTFHKPRITEEDSQRVRVQFTVPSDQDNIRVTRVEPSFLKVSKPARMSRGLWQFSVQVPKDSPEAAKYQPDNFLEGRILLQTSANEAPIAVRVKWDPEKK